MEQESTGMTEPKYIDAELLRAKMYHDAFETDSEEQKWDSGCWIRYKMFERNIEAAPAADVVEIIRCKDCKHWKFDHTCHEHSLVSPMMANDFCSRAERRADESD